MKKYLKHLLVIAFVIPCIFICSACGSNNNTFGEFGYNGKYLTPFAQKEITYNEAKNIVTKQTKQKYNVNSTTLSVEPLPTESEINAILTRYGSCQILTKYYISDKQKEQQKKDEITGTDFKIMLTNNKFTAYSQIITKFLICNNNIIDFMEQKNTDFKNSPESDISPNKNIFSYHKDNKGMLVIRTHNFSEISASENGGVACNFKQDTEILYDAENKIQKWQTSLGLSTAAPTGTTKQGFILSVEFKWIEKN